MNRIYLCLVMLSLVCTGCPAPGPSGTGGTGSVGGEGPATSETSGAPVTDMTEPGGTDPGSTEPAADSAATAGNQVALTPANATIQFVGTHKGDKPDPRTGKFEEFSGAATVEEGVLKAISVEITTDSLSTEIEKLTTHLKSPDFFDVRQHPKATFQTTSIEDAGDGNVNVTGDLTLLGNTKSIIFPATVSTAEARKRRPQTRFLVILSNWGELRLDNWIRFTRIEVACNGPTHFVILLRRDQNERLPSRRINNFHRTAGPEGLLVVRAGNLYTFHVDRC